MIKLRQSPFIKFYLLALLSLAGNTLAQSNPYESECAILTDRVDQSGFSCAAYINCQLVGGLSEICASQITDRDSHSKSPSSLRRVMEADEAQAAAKRKSAALDNQSIRKQNQEQQNRYFLQQQQLLQYRIDQKNQQHQQNLQQQKR